MMRNACYFKRTIATVFFAALLAGGVSSTGVVYANPITQVDQQNLVFNIPFENGNTNGYGQSFTPTLSGIDAFEFFAGASNPPTATNWQINLRENTLAGTILGTSNPVSGVFTPGAAINFMFPTTIALTPGNVYVAEILFSTSGNSLAIQVDSNPYSGGAIVGAGLDDSDYKFREGLSDSTSNPIPEPSTMLLLGSGLVGLIGYRWRRNTDVRLCPALDPTTNK